MALTHPSASPAVIVKEIDLSGTIPNVQTSTGAVVGNFGWGPIDQRTLVSSETSLVSTFASPSKDNAVDFLSAAYFLKYSSSLYVVRSNNGGANASTDPIMELNPDGTESDVIDLSERPVVKNADDWDSLTDQDIHGSFIAKYAGELGNALKVSVCGNADFAGWDYSDLFTSAPGTSDWAAAREASNDEVHVVVIDRTGEISGTPDTVLEMFEYVSVALGAKGTDGGNNYIGDVLDNQSKYVWFAGTAPDGSWSPLSGTAPDVDAATNYGFGQFSLNLAGGVASEPMDIAKIKAAFDLFVNAETVEVDFLIAPQSSTSDDADEVITHLEGIARQRKDCVVVASPDKTSIDGADKASDIVALSSSLPTSSYLVMDNNFVKVFDKYNNKYVNIPAASSTAGVMAASDIASAPWFSPAGSRRGVYLGITDIVWNADKSERDTLYKSSINPIANIPGQGVVLFGDKTHLKRPSAFDRINVRRLFLALERAITVAGKNVMFEFNDEFTRAEFVNIVEPLLREIQGRRGLTDFKVVCDESNNTSEVVDRNEFVASIFIKPARSINYVTLNFVAVRTGVVFEEIVGTV